MPFDFKKEYKEFYLPAKKPSIVTIPEMNFLAIRGSGDPNVEGGAYQTAVGQLYAIAYTLKMSEKGMHKIDGYFPYVVPPLEGFWWQQGVCGVDYSHKETFQWISVIRLPDFIREEDFHWAIAEATRKKQQNFSAVMFLPYNEGLCVQCMHVGPYDDEPATISAMQQFAAEEGYAIDITPQRYHHEIYLSDPRRTSAAKQRTVVRHPVRKV